MIPEQFGGKKERIRRVEIVRVTDERWVSGKMGPEGRGW